MKKVNSLFLLCIVFLFKPAYAIEINTTTANFPFLNIMLNAGDTVQSNYSFKDASGNTHPMIFCFPNNGGSANIGDATLTWPYKGATQSSDLATQGQLKINANYAGAFADFNGTLTITNNTSTYMFVNCQYGF